MYANYACMCTSMNVCTCECMCVCVYVCVCTMYANYACMCTGAHVCICECMCVCVLTSPMVSTIDFKYPYINRSCKNDYIIMKSYNYGLLLGLCLLE